MKCPELPRLTLHGLATARSTHMNQRTGCGVVHLDLICLVSSHKWQACRARARGCICMYITLSVVCLCENVGLVSLIVLGWELCVPISRYYV